MLFLIFFVIIGVLLAIAMSGSESSIYTLVLFWALGVMIPMCIGLWLSSLNTDSKLLTEVTTTENIYALNDTAEQNSYIFSGDENGSLEYTYITMTENGKHMNQVNTNDAFIDEEDNIEQPYVECQNYILANDFLRWGITLQGDESIGDTTYIFHVPTGTTTTTYNIDLQ